MIKDVTETLTATIKSWGHEQDNTETLNFESETRLSHFLTSDKDIWLSRVE